MSNRPQNPEPAVGAIVCRKGRVLLVQRNRPPGRGLWAIPGGRIQLGETLQQAAEREVMEETGIVVEAGEPVYTFDLIERDVDGVLFHYVIVDLLAQYRGGKLSPGDDASDARWVAPEEIGNLPATQATQRVLENFFFH